MIVAVIIASLGRPEALADLLDDLARQSTAADRLVLSLTQLSDAPSNLEKHGNSIAVYGPKGLCAQRNRGLAEVGSDADLVVFLDDDFVPSRFMIERAVALFEAYPEIAGATGHLVADGINGPGFSTSDARRLLNEYDSAPAPLLVPSHNLRGLYGCNMVYRTQAILGLSFDERLPLYGWQEDIDFGVQAAACGRTVKTFAFAGVHCGVKGARISGLRTGYSQVINPAYLVRKGTMDGRYARKIVLRNIVANHMRAFRPEPWVDRMGRARGNWLAMFDLIRGRVTPERILDL
jgi:glycosyltransferase involved in cell wall biosynthesis